MVGVEEVAGTGKEEEEREKMGQDKEKIKGRGKKAKGGKVKTVTFKQGLDAVTKVYKFEEDEIKALREGLGIIRFHKEYYIWGWASNFYVAAIKVNGVVWKTTEHFFQAQKFEDGADSDTDYQMKIHQASTPGEAAALGRDRSHPIRNDWEGVKEEIMVKALRAKFTQNKSMGRLLRRTFPFELQEEARRDPYWGTGHDGRGRNRLGVLLQKVREELLAADHSKDAAKGPGQQAGAGVVWSEADHWSHLDCSADKCPCCRAAENKRCAGGDGGATVGLAAGGRRYVVHVCEVCDPLQDLQVPGGDAALIPRGGAGGVGGAGGRGEKGSGPDGAGETKDGGSASGGARSPSMARGGGGKGAPGGASLPLLWLGQEELLQPKEALPSPPADDDVAAEGLGDEQRPDLWLPGEEPGEAGGDGEDPGRPRKGTAWCDLTRVIQERVKEAVENNAAVIECQHRLVLGGRCGGRLIVPEATWEGLQGRTCCSTSRAMGRAAKLRVDPPGARHPKTVLNIEQMRADIDEVNARGGLQFTDLGLWDSLAYGIEVGFVGERQGVLVFPVSQGTLRDPGATLVKAAIQKDLTGLPDVQGVLVPNTVRLGSTPEEAMATLWERFPQLQPEPKWLLAFAVGAVPASLGRSARLVDDMSRGPEPASCNNNTPPAATPLLRLGGGKHFKREVLRLRRARPGVRLLFAKADFSSWFRQSKAQGRSAPVNVFTDPATGILMLREGAGFGARTYPASTSRVTVCIAFYLIVGLGLRVQLYIDDVILIAYEDENLRGQWDMLLGLFKQWNVKVSQGKCIYFQLTVDWLGVHYDVPRGLVRVTDARRERMLLICDKVYKDTFLTIKLLQSFYHSILSVLSMVEGSKACLQETARLLKVGTALEKSNVSKGVVFRGMRPTALLQMEVVFWAQLLRLNDGAALQGNFVKKQALRGNFAMVGATDASTTGVGGVFTDPEDPETLTYYHHEFTETELLNIGKVCLNKVDVEDQDAWTIGVLELWTLVMFVEMFFARLSGRCGEPPAVWNILNDNANTVAWVNAMWSKAPNGLVALLLRQLAFLELAGNFRLVVTWVASRENTCADALSRQDYNWFKRLTSAIPNLVRRQVPDKYLKMLLAGSDSCWTVGETPTLKQREQWAKGRGSSSC